MQKTHRYYRRRSTSTKEGAQFKKDNQQDHSFFGESSHVPFFKPANSIAQAQSVQRKCADCEKEDKAHRMPEKKEEDKKVMKKEDKKEEEKVHRMPEKKEEEKKVMKKEEKKEEEKLHRKENGESSSTTQTDYAGNMQGKGNPLPEKVRLFFSARLGADLSAVKIHTGTEASASAKALHAKAYTVGNDIVFSEGQYNAESDEGRKLLAHELAHVVQQNGNLNKAQLKNEEKDPTPKTINIPAVHTKGKPSRDRLFAKNVRFDGKTDADFDGGTGATKNLKGIPAKECDGCDESECLTITGTFEITYKVTTNVTLPDVPDGLTPCQQTRVKDAIDHKIAPHEQQHVKKFETYNGVKKLPINYKGCKDGLQAYLQNLNDVDGEARKAAAKKLSAALDPFIVNVDLDCVDKPAK